MRYLAAVLVLALVAPAFAETPFADVPRTHWAYDAIQKAVDGGILQGYDGKFHGNRLLNRFQMAVIVAKLQDGMRARPELGRGLEGSKTVANVEALTIEFADELAMLNVKVSTLEDTCTELKNEMAALKGGRVLPSAGCAAPGGGPGFTAFAQVGLINTGDNTGGNAGPPPYSVARTRYPVPNPGSTFFTLPQVGIGIDREVNPGVYLHAQLDFYSDVNAGGGVQINEAYFMVDELIGDLGAKVGAFALPYTMEHNGPFRTCNYTITPSVAGTFFEGFRPYGLEFQRTKGVKPEDIVIKVGVASNTDAALSLPGATLYPFSLNDTPVGINTNSGVGEIDTGLGYYLYIAKHPEKRGLGWNLGYFVNGGDTAATLPAISTMDVDFYEVGFEYWSNRWGFQGQYVGASVTPDAVAGSAYDAVMWYFLFNLKVDNRNNVSLRYDAWSGDVTAAGLQDVSGDALTFAVNHKVTENSLMQFEYLTPSDDVPTGSTDVKDDQVQLRYKVHF